MPRIDRCICYNRTFAELKDIADRHDLHELGELQQRVEFGKNCCLCHPYVREMLRSGQVVFTKILTDRPNFTRRPPSGPQA